MIPLSATALKYNNPLFEYNIKLNEIGEVWR